MRTCLCVVKMFASADDGVNPGALESSVSSSCSRSSTLARGCWHHQYSAPSCLRWHQC